MLLYKHAVMRQKPCEIKGNHAMEKMFMYDRRLYHCLESFLSVLQQILIIEAELTW